MKNSYKKAAELITKWANEPGDYDEKVMKELGKKTFADTCLERADKINKLPKGSVMFPIMNQEFSTRARQDVPELAMRLKKACQFLRDVHSYDDERAELADELESPPGEK